MEAKSRVRRALGAERDGDGKPGRDGCSRCNRASVWADARMRWWAVHTRATGAVLEAVAALAVGVGVGVGVQGRAREGTGLV